jgi:hypothetical protein
MAIPELYDSLCASCHADDTPTCAACHNHHIELFVSTDRPSYLPGSPVTVTFSGGTEPGWIRALLYDSDGEELDRVTGPTGTGDDGTGPSPADSLIIPVTLTAEAPSRSGAYTWRAAYYGVFSPQELTHLEIWAPVIVHVADPDRPSIVERRWAAIKDLFREL